MNSAEATSLNRRESSQADPYAPTLQTPDAAVSRLADIVAAASTGIDHKSGLASDYLNQFNEVSMLLDMASDDIELLDELNDWMPRDYAEHFQASNFRDSQLVLEAYGLSPPVTRQQFDRLSNELGMVIRSGLESIWAAGDNTDVVEQASQALAVDVRSRIATLSAIIHPTEKIPSDSEISVMFAARR